MHIQCKLSWHWVDIEHPCYLFLSIRSTRTTLSGYSVKIDWKWGLMSGHWVQKSSLLGERKDENKQIKHERCGVWKLNACIGRFVKQGLSITKKEQNSSTPRLPLSSPTRVLVWRNRAWLPRADESGYVHGAMIEPWHVTSSTRISILALNPNLFTGFRVTPVLHHQPLSIIYCLNMLTYFSKCSEYHIRPCIFTMVVQQILIAYRMCHLKSRPYNT